MAGGCGGSIHFTSTPDDPTGRDAYRESHVAHEAYDSSSDLYEDHAEAP